MSEDQNELFVPGPQTLWEARQVRKQIFFDKGEPILLRTDFAKKDTKKARSFLTIGFFTLVNETAQLAAKIEQSGAINDNTYEASLQLIRALGTLVREDQSDIFHLTQTPKSSLYFSKRPADFDQDHQLPTITTYKLRRSAHTKNINLPETIFIELMENDHRYFRRGYKNLEPKVLNGLQPQQARAALSQTTTPPEIIDDILENTSEKNAYVEFETKSNLGWSCLRLETVPDSDEVELTMKYPPEELKTDMSKHELLLHRQF